MVVVANICMDVSKTLIGLPMFYQQTYKYLQHVFGYRIMCVLILQASLDKFKIQIRADYFSFFSLKCRLAIMDYCNMFHSTCFKQIVL